jgi:hypothetical protein
MSDEMMTDLGPLGTDDVPDVASRAVRRFRLHVVLFTVACVLGAAILSGMVVRWATRDLVQTHATGWTAAQTAVLNDLVGICSTPTFTVGGLQVGLLDAAKMSGGGTALHLAVHGPITDQRSIGDADSAVRSTSFRVAGEQKTWGVMAQPGATWGEAYVQVPTQTGPRVQVMVSGPALALPQSFMVDLSALHSGC